MSLIKSNSIQIGQSSTATQNFTLSVPSSPDGTIKLARGNSGATTADIFSVNGSGAITGATISGATINSSTVNGGSITLGTEQATTSGTAIDFTGIPSWVKKITVMLNGVSTNGTSEVILQIGDSGGVETSGYLGSMAQLPNATALFAANFSSSIRVDGGTNAAAVRHGAIRISLINQDSNLWSFDGSIGRSDAAVCSCLGGVKSLSGALDRIRLTTVNGTDTFDAGSVNIMYEG